MSKTHWRKCQNPKYLGSYELLPGQELTLTISKADTEMVEGSDGKTEECLVAHFVEKNFKPMIINIENSKIIEEIYGTPYIEDWVGKKITVYSKKVKAFGKLVDALRIRPFIPKGVEHKCSDCMKVVGPAHGMSAERIAEHTKKTHGRILCAECGAKAKAAKEATKTEGDALNENNETQN